MTNLKKLASFFKIRYPWRSSFKQNKKLYVLKCHENYFCLHRVLFLSNKYWTVRQTGTFIKACGAVETAILSKFRVTWFPQENSRRSTFILLGNYLIPNFEFLSCHWGDGSPESIPWDPHGKVESKFQLNSSSALHLFVRKNFWPMVSPRPTEQSRS